MMTLLVFVIALSILVFVHEWGHFIVAKLSGVRVDIFSIGFGPKILGFKWHGTEYRLAPFPFGGYVKIYGQEPLEEADGDPVKAEQIARDTTSFHSKSTAKKLATVFAGPAMNIILCFAVLPFVFMVGRLQPKILDEKPVVIDISPDSPAEKLGLQKGDEIVSLNNKETATWKELLTQISLYPDAEVFLHYRRDGQDVTVKANLTTHKEIKQTAGYLGIEPFSFYDNEPVIDTIKPDSAAAKAGFQPGDWVLSVNDEPIKYWTQMTELIQKAKGAPLTMMVKRGDVEVVLTATAEFNEGMGAWILGLTKKINPDSMVKKSHSFFAAIPVGFDEGLRLMGLTFEVLGRLFTGQLSYKTLGGPIQIAQATSAAARTGFGEFLYLLAFLSLQLGVMNLLPIPVLDGGHVLFMAVEAIRRRPLSPKFRHISTQVGLVTLLGLMLIVTVNDVNSVWGFSNILDKIKGIF
jgi:regulator of sigma E protease